MDYMDLAERCVLKFCKYFPSTLSPCSPDLQMAYI